MQCNPGLHQLELFGGQITFQQIAVRYLEHCVKLCIFNMDMGEMMLLGK